MYSRRNQHIRIDFSQHTPSVTSMEMQKHVDHMFLVLSELLPPDLLFSEHIPRNRILNKKLPLIHHTISDNTPGCLTLSILCHALPCQDFYEFFQHLARYQLVPGKILHIANFSHCYFYFPDDNENRYYLAEVQLILSNEYELEKAETLLPQLIHTIKTSAHNPILARHVLERQQIWEDSCSAAVQKFTLYVINKRLIRDTPTLLKEMSSFLLFCDSPFKKPRTGRHLARILFTIFWLRKRIEEAKDLSHAERHLFFRLIPATLQYTFGRKKALGLCIGINPLCDYEVFHQRHILSALQSFLPDAKIVQSSYFHYHQMGNPMDIHYLEVEGNSPKAIPLNLLRQKLSSLQEKLTSSIEHVTPELFMHRNEEETMKHMITLSSELTTPNSLPQVMISFDSQSPSSLKFTVLLVRVLKKDSLSLQQILENSTKKDWELFLEKTFIVNYIRKYPKEAVTFSLKIKKASAFLRANSSINLYEVRQQVVEFLTKKFGPIRDYTGGLIDCQQELYVQFKEYFHKFAQDFPMVIESFFYSFTPMESRATLPFPSIKTLFCHFLALTKQENQWRDHYLIKKSADQHFAYAIMRMPIHFFEENVKSVPDSLRSSCGKVNYTQFQHQGFLFLGFIQSTLTELDRDNFYAALESALTESIRYEQKMQCLKLAFQISPISLDPRISIDISAYHIDKLLFEGLMRLDAEGVPQCAVAEKYHLTDDRKTYTFTLRRCTWSDGSPVTAHDFVYAWKKILSPNFPTPFAYLLYSIKNAKKAKMGKLSIDAIGVQAVDEQTLRVNLEHPTPYFLELAAFTLLYPIKNHIDDRLPDWAFCAHPHFISNGPFRLISSTPGKQYILEKNMRYWDSDHVQLDKVILNVAEGSTALEMFKQGRIDWLGCPAGPWEHSFASFGAKVQVHSPIFLMIVCNIHSFPLSHRKFRQALSWAMNRKELINHLGVPSEPSSTFFLKSQNIENFCLPFVEGDPNYARQIFQEALEEMQLDPKKLPVLTLFHTEENASIRSPFLQAMQKQLKEVLGLTLNLETLPWGQISRKLISGDYQLAIASWHNYFNTPYYLYDAFKTPQRNFYLKWENSQFQHTLEAANHETDPIKHQKILDMAECILIEDAPVIPLVREVSGYIKNPRLVGYHGEKAGFFDFKEAYFESKQENHQDLIHWL